MVKSLLMFSALFSVKVLPEELPIVPPLIVRSPEPRAAALPKFNVLPAFNVVPVEVLLPLTVSVPELTYVRPV